MKGLLGSPESAGCILKRDQARPLVVAGTFGSKMSDMDRDEALKLLQGGEAGIREWNGRLVEGEDIPDLSKAELSGADLSGANLSHANFSGANLNGADLSGANLSYGRLAVPIQPILEESSREYGMFPDFSKYPWVLAIHHYGGIGGLLASLADEIIAPAEEKVKELKNRRVK